MTWNFSGDHLSKGGNINGNINLKNYWGLYGGVNTNFDKIGNTILRGGPLMRLPADANYWFGLSTDSRKKYEVDLEINQSASLEKASKYFSIGPKIIFKPINTLSFSIHPSFSTSFDELQYVEQTSFGAQDRYVFASIDQKTISMSFRVNFNLTPDLTLQYWGQPFVASGKYYNFKYITSPMASEFRDRFHVYNTGEINLVDNDHYSIHENFGATEDYTISKPDFNVKEFLSNLVIRWEYNPGSSLYLVWSQTRSNYNSSGNLDLFNDLGDLFNTADNKPHNVFLIKFSYRFGLK